MKGKNSIIDDDQSKQIVERNKEIIHALKNLSQQINSDKKDQLCKGSEKINIEKTN
jgi:uncharacterized protein YccT (UPF0319 family)